MNDVIQEMVDWIEGRLTGRFSLDGLAAYMGYSPYYCSFKFHQTTGMSLRRYVLQRRLYMSMKDLAEQRPILDVALDYQYSSQEAYSRAFKGVFGISPKVFQLGKLPVQSFPKLSVTSDKGMIAMNRSREQEVARLQADSGELFECDVLNVLNGQMMYEEFAGKQLMGDSQYVPFNEAMCVHETAAPVFSDDFIGIRADGHGETREAYHAHVMTPLKPLFDGDFHTVVLWFGEDMFCQMNALTVLAYLEQSGFTGRVYLNSFREDEFKVDQTELTLGCYKDAYWSVLIEHRQPACSLLPVMHQAVGWYLTMLEADNPVTHYIRSNPQLQRDDLLQHLFRAFPMIGYGDTQYLELVGRIR